MARTRQRKILNVLRWTFSAGLTGTALVYLNSTAYWWWLSWGPPVSDPSFARAVAVRHALISGVALLAAVGAFFGLRRLTR